MNLIDTFEKVLTFLKDYKREEALDCLNKIEDKIPDTGSIQKIVGQFYQWIGEDEKSLKYISRAHKLLPDDNSLLLCLGYHYLDNSLPKKAANYFQQYLLVEPVSPRVLCFLARAYDYDGNKEKAEQTLRQVSTEAPHDLEMQLHFGRILMSNRKYHEARKCFENLSLFYPKDFMVEIGLKRSTAFAAGSIKTNIKTKSKEPATVVCVKYGSKYGPIYVNRLASMVRRWSSVETDFICFTEDPSGLDTGIRTLPLPIRNLSGQKIHGYWNKLALFRDRIQEVSSHMLYFDLDVVITGTIEPLLFYDSDFAMASNCYAPSFSSSVMRIKNGVRPEIWTDFSEFEVEEELGDEDWISLKVPDADIFPEDWCSIYRLHAVQGIPEGSIVVSFGGKPNPDEYPSPWIKNYWY